MIGSGTSSVVMLALEALNIAALLLVGPLEWVLHRLVGQASRFRLACPTLGAFAGFSVEFASLRSAAALIGERHDLDFPNIPALGHANQGTHFHAFAGLGAIAIVVHLATFNGLLGKCPGLEEASRPQPFVESYTIHCALLLHRFHRAGLLLPAYRHKRVACRSR